jgi:hypothetical protein
MRSPLIAVLCVLLVLVWVTMASRTAIAQDGVAVEKDALPIACQLDVFTDEERSREQELLRDHLSSVLEVRERDDGYSFRYAPDPALFKRMAELVSLEHRCCPFLDFELKWAGTEESPWLQVTGDAAAKSFVWSAFVPRQEEW